ncbi:MAG: NADH-quinone oxidoreductase subunit NuoE [Oxalobacter sp.]
MLLTEDAYRKIEKELAKFPPTKKLSAAIAVLTIVQEEKGWLSPEILMEVAEYLKVPVVALKEVASFYSMFNTHPVGKYKLAICGNLPCEMNGSDRLTDYLKDKLGIGFGETTPDGLFTLVESECMGACGDGPVILVNNHVMHMHMSKEKVDRLLEELRA